jgi:TetR/AcrR family transcriptional regulator of autoinduction and epiphytic fitness
MSKAAISKPKRIRRDPDTTRGLILDAAQRLMIAEGYASVSSRRIAQDIGVNAATVHYYYATIDDLFLALLQRMITQQTVALEAAVASDSPLEAFWDFQANWNQSALGVELIALSNHRKSIRGELSKIAERGRDVQTEALQRAIEASGAELADISPIALTTIIVAIARTLANEERVGVTRGHEEVRAVVERALKRLIVPASPLPPTSRQ